MPSATLKIAYNVLMNPETDDYEIFTMNPDGSEKQNITNSAGLDWVYHAHGQKIYFVSDRDTARRHYFLYEMNFDGSDVRKMYQHRLYDSWISSRENGSEFILTVKLDTVKTFVIVDKNGVEISRPLATNDFEFNDPCFSPDGKQIVFRSHESGKGELWIMDENGGNRHQLTHYPENDTTGGQHFYRAGPPFWAKASNTISYISKQNSNYSIFTIKPDGSSQKQLTGNEMNEGWHVWSPDGKHIAFNGSNLEDDNFDIYLINADGSGMKRLTKDMISEQAPVFVETSN